MKVLSELESIVRKKLQERKISILSEEKQPESTSIFFKVKGCEYSVTFEELL